jgi:hypothetical protein
MADDRATPEQVLEIMDADTALTAGQVEPYLVVAERMMVERGVDSGVANDITKREIHRWLTAHFIAMSDRELTLMSQRVGEASEAYVGEFGKGLEGTRYGQMAMTIDPTAILSRVGKRRATIEVLDVVTGGTD